MQSQHVSPFPHKIQRTEGSLTDWKRGSPAEVPTQDILAVPESKKQNAPKQTKQIKNFPKTKDPKTLLPENNHSAFTTWTSGSKVATGNNPHPTAKSQLGHHSFQPVTSPLYIQQLNKLVILKWANELKTLDYLLGHGKFGGESQKRLDNILSLLEANQDHPHWTKKLLQENELHTKVFKVWTTAEYCKKSRNRAGKIYSMWRKRQMIGSLKGVQC